MKTKNKIILILFSIPLTLLAVSCNGDKPSHRTTVVAAAAPAYVAPNGTCYSQAGQVVPCNSGYYSSGGYCYASTGEMVDFSKCSAISTTPNPFYGNSGCVGNYYYFDAYNNMQWITCNGANCSGNSLMDSSGQPVQCP